jgi:hypothetical protein
MDELTSLIAVAAAGSLASAIFELFSAYFQKKRTPVEQTLDERIASLSQALSSASQTISQIETEIGDRQKLVVELQNDAERHKHILELEPEKVKAISSMLTQEIKKDNRRSFWVGILVNFLFFLAGAGVSYILEIRF